MSVSQANFNVNIIRYRNDTVEQRFQLLDDNGLPIPITDRLFQLGVDPQASPPNTDNNIYSIAGVIRDAANGVFSFPFSTSNSLAAAGSFFYDIEMTFNPGTGTVTKTIGGGTWTIKQGIS